MRRLILHLCCWYQQKGPILYLAFISAASYSIWLKIQLWGTKSTKGYVPLQEADDRGVNLIVYFSKGENNKWAGERFHDGKIHIKSNIPN